MDRTYSDYKFFAQLRPAAAQKRRSDPPISAKHFHEGISDEITEMRKCFNTYSSSSSTLGDGGVEGLSEEVLRHGGDKVWDMQSDPCEVHTT